MALFDNTVTDPETKFFLRLLQRNLQCLSNQICRHRLLRSTFLIFWLIELRDDRSLQRSHTECFAHIVVEVQSQLHTSKVALEAKFASLLDPLVHLVEVLE